VIGTLEIVSPLFHYPDNPEELPIESVVVLSCGRAFSKVEIYEEKNLESVILDKDASDCEKSLASVCRNIGFRMIKFWRIGAPVKALLSIRTASLASRFHSDLLEPCVFSKTEMGANTMAYF
jgi:hypothetical protein